MMTHQAGVRTVVVGGQPKNGPMQAVSGSRGAVAYTADILDTDFDFATNVNETAATILPTVHDTGMYLNYAGFTLRDQVRENDSIPLQFKYQAADCRIYFTLRSAYNLTRLWLDAAAAIWDDPSICVQGSTGYATASNNCTQAKPPPPRQESFYNDMSKVAGQTTLKPNIVDDHMFNGLLGGEVQNSASDFQTCSTGCGQCYRGIACPGTTTTVDLCAISCSQVGAPCGGGLGICRPGVQHEQKQGKVVTTGKSAQSKYCEPIPKAPFTSCPNVKKAV